MIQRSSIFKNSREKKVEILAPAGSYESFRAAVAAGADAVYAGGSRFGARAFAENFTEEQLLKAIDYAHLHGRRFYLTVNTLLKDHEIDCLAEYLEPLYRGGLDAVIVQDVGVMGVVRTQFPDMEIHASTQMTLTGTYGARFLKEMGAVRVVPARELSLAEVRAIKAETGMEIECFVHGALCYSYSGQCLLSSLIGGRSGNRGQCAQPCRLPYSAEGTKGYLLSLKDICTLDLIPELIEAGIDSFKIEGRMKRPEYVAGVTSMYRKYVDLYLQHPDKPYRVDSADKEMLMDLFNRGGFHEGYYKHRNGRDMVSMEKPNHIGVRAVRVLSQKGRELTVRALTEISGGDLIEFPNGTDRYTCGQYCKKGKELVILAPKGVRLPVGTELYRVRNGQLLEQLASEYLDGKVQEPVYGFLHLSVGESAKLVVCKDEYSVEVKSEDVVEQPVKSPLPEERIRKQMNKTGNTEFVFGTLDIEAKDDVFLPMQQLNGMRRSALEQLEEKICGSFHRNPQAGYMGVPGIPRESVSYAEGESAALTGKETHLSVLVETEGQFEGVLNQPEGIRRIYADSILCGDGMLPEFWQKMADRVHAVGIELFLAMPRIFRKQTAVLFEESYESVTGKIFDGVLVRSYEEYQFLKEYRYKKKMILDYNQYIMNRFAKNFWRENGAADYTIPVELNKAEIEKLGASGGEMIIYGYLPAMVTAQCVTGTVGGCTKTRKITVLKDRYQNAFKVENYCRDCYNVIYNSKPLYLLDLRHELETLHAGGYRIQFSTEDKAETETVLKQYRQSFLQRVTPEIQEEQYTRGHFHRGVS